MSYRFSPLDIDNQEHDNSDFDCGGDIREDEERTNLNDELDIDDLGERDYYSATHICQYCNGIDFNCFYCNGTGTIKRKY